MNECTRTLGIDGRPAPQPGLPDLEFDGASIWQGHRMGKEGCTHGHSAG